jgi:hypothetical protein
MGAGGAVLGAHAWAYLRRDPAYRAAWAAHGVPPRFEAAGRVEDLWRVAGRLPPPRRRRGRGPGTRSC